MYEPIDMTDFPIPPRKSPNKSIEKLSAKKIGPTPEELDAKLEAYAYLRDSKDSKDIKFTERKYRLSLKRALEVFHYDPDTGTLTRRIKTGKACAGSTVDCVRYSGYLGTGIDGEQLLAHQIICLLQLGRHLYVEEILDHIDGNKLNNAWSNLRVVNQSINQLNQTKPSKNNNSGYLGVAFDKSRNNFMATITIKRENINLGRYATAVEAANAYKKAKEFFYPGLVQQ